MALNLSLSAEDLAEQNRMNEAERMRGDVTEVSQGPEVDNKPIQMAGGSALTNLFRNIRANRVKDITPSGQPGRVPTPQEKPIMQDSGDFSMRKTQQEQAERLLSEEGQKQFKEQGYKADLPQDDLLFDAQKALDDQVSEAEKLATDVNKQAKKALQGNIEVGGIDNSKSVAKNVAPEELADEFLELRKSAIDLANGGTDFNFKNIKSTDQIKETIETISQQFKDPQNVVTRGMRSNNVTTEDAIKLAADDIGFKRKILARKVGEGFNAEELVAARHLLVDSAQQLNNLAVKIEAGNADAIDRLAFRRQLAIHAGIQLQIKGAQTEAARALQSFNINVGGEMDALRAGREAQRILNENGAAATTNELAAKILKLQKEEGLGAVNEFAEKGFGSKLKRQVHEAYLAGLLWQTSTQFKNIIGSGSFMAYQLFSEQIAGIYGSIIRAGYKATGQARKIPEDQVYLNDAYLRFRGWMDSYKDALRTASIAMKTETPSTQYNRADLEDYRSITAEVDGSDTLYGRSLNMAGRLTRLPFTLLLGGDEYFKTISMRGELNTLINQRYQYHRNQGLTDQQAADKAGMLALDPDAVAKELDTKARYDTMMSDLGQFGKVSGLVQRTWLGRFILPFSTAPTNSALATSDFTPYFAPRTYMDLTGKNGAKRHQMALGKLATGGATMALVAEYATEGRITGSYPRDKKVREALPPGWQPYSLVFKKNEDAWPTDENDNPLPLYDKYGRPNGELTYVSFGGFEPVGAIVGITADIVQRMVLTRDPEMRQGFIMAALAATADYYTQLPMLQGLSDITSAIEDGNITNLVRGPAEAATPIGFPNPMSGLQRMINRINDPIKTKTTVPLEYYSIKDAEQKNEDGSLVYEHPAGGPDYRIVGLAKNDTTTQFMTIIKQMDAYQSKDSMFRDEKDRNVVLFDTLGNVLGAEDAHWATKPGVALWNNITGIKLKDGAEPSEMERELVRIAVNTNGWPLTEVTNRKANLRLSNRNVSDWVNLAKNEMYLDKYGAQMQFRDALQVLVLADVTYQKQNDFDKAKLIKSLERDYLNAGFEAMMALEGNENLARAYYEMQMLKEYGVRK